MALAKLALGSFALVVGCTGGTPARNAGSAQTGGAETESPVDGGSKQSLPGEESASSSAAGVPESDAGAGTGGSPREPEVPILPYPAEPFDLEAVRKLRARLSEVAVRVLPGAHPAGEGAVGKLAPGQTLERSYAIEKEGCYTAVALAEAGGVSDFGLELVEARGSRPAWRDIRTTSTAVAGAPPDCARASAGMELRVVISAVAGAGLVAAQLYVR